MLPHTVQLSLTNTFNLNFMVYRIIGGIFLLLVGLQYVGLGLVPEIVTGVLGIIAGIALLAGI